MIAIVGAGITGLTLAHELRRAGIEHIVLESAERPGGVMRSDRIDGSLLERGPQRARMTGDLAGLVDELGLRDEVLTAPPELPLFVYTAGKLRRVPFSPSDFLRTDLFSTSGKLRLLLEPFTRGPRDDERVSELFTRKAGKEAYERLLGPLYGGLYASDPADMVVGLSLAHAIRELGGGRSLLLPLLKRGGRVSPPPAVSFREGLQALPLALHAANRENVKLGAPVTRIRRSADGFVLSAAGAEVGADRVVITTAARQAADLLREVDASAAERISSLRYNPLAVVHLRSDLRLRGLGYQVALGESMSTRGVTFNHALFGREGVYTAYLGGARSPEVADWPDDAVADSAVQEFEQVTGAGASVLSVGRVAVPAWDATWAALDGLVPPAGVTLATNWVARPGIPGRLAQAKRLARDLARAGDAAAAPGGSDAPHPARARR